MPAAARAARCAAFGPTQSASAASGAVSATISPCMETSIAAVSSNNETASMSLHMIAIAGKRIHDSDLLHREIGDDLDRILVHDQHLLDADPVAEFLAVLGLQRECHAFLDLHRMV